MSLGPKSLKEHESTGGSSIKPRTEPESLSVSYEEPSTRWVFMNLAIAMIIPFPPVSNIMIVSGLCY